MLSQTHKPIDIYYVDNDSQDSSLDYVKESFPNVKLITPGYNSGFAKGNNIAIEQALKDPDVNYIALLNSDARVKQDWASLIIEFALKKPKAALLQGTTLDYYNHEIIDSTHVYVSLNGQGTQGNWRYHYQRDLGPKKVFGVNAAACLITREFIESQPFPQLFDERMFMYLEDVDLVSRATIMGWDNYLVPKARAFHMGSASSTKNPNFSLYMTFRNNSALLYKNFPLKMLLKMIPQVIRGDIDTVRVLRRMHKKSAAREVIRGRIVGIFRLPLFITKRRKVQKNMNIPEGYLQSLMRNGY